MIKKLRKINHMIVGLLLGWVTFQAHAAVVENVRLWQAPDHTRFVFDLQGQAEHRLLMLENPRRLVIDLAASHLSADTRSLPLEGTPVNNVRSGVRNGSDLRIVLDLREEVKPRSFFLHANERYGERLVIDLYQSDAGQAKAKPKVVQSAQRDIVIALDAGHGGEDPGAIGPKGIKEKQVVFELARELKRIIDAQTGFRAVLVRSGDYYVGLRQRRELAREAQADLFVSIHADAFKLPSARGGSVYALSQRGATSASAAFLAEKENGADLIGGVGLRDKDELLAEVLTDLSMTASLDSSLKLGNRVIRSMGSVAHLHKKKVEQAGFAVLKSPDIPSILIETGFISNPAEARQLANRAYQRKLAGAILNGMLDHYNENPPPGTLLAARIKERATPVEYVIARGDTLSGIAQRYRVSVGNLKRLNGLSGNVIRTGQRIVIPTS